MAFSRCSGLLLHPTSFPGPHGIGDLGQAAYEFVDFLSASGQRLWQVLPLGPTGYEHSPYTMNFSAFAGNPLLISLGSLAADGLLEAAPPPLQTTDPSHIDYDAVIAHKTPYLQQAFGRFQPSDDFQQFCQSQRLWLEDYALFMALHETYGGPWNQWPEPLARRQPAALAAVRERYREALAYHRWVQFTFFQQWLRLRAYAQGRGIEIIGDISIYVCYHSADVWAHPRCFKLDSNLAPTHAAGVPPDRFSATGQLWGNPIYNWEYLKESGYRWWLQRFEATLAYVDIVRIDHFRGFEAYWQVPAGEPEATRGEWVPGPGAAFFDALQQRLGGLPVLAEDLGIITPAVEALRQQFGFPGMRILQFAFGEGPEHPYLPHNYERNTVVYVGTHDNETALGWWAQAPAMERRAVAAYVGAAEPKQLEAVNWVLMRLAMASVADVAVLQLQDVLGLGNEGRMNDPSTAVGNWRWRYGEGALTKELAARLRELVGRYGR